MLHRGEHRVRLWTHKVTHGLTPPLGLPRRLSRDGPASQHTRHGFHLWVGKIPWRRNWPPTPGFLLGNPVDRGTWEATLYVIKELDLTYWLNNNTPATYTILEKTELQWQKQLSGCQERDVAGTLWGWKRSTLEGQLRRALTFARVRTACVCVCVCVCVWVCEKW